MGEIYALKDLLRIILCIYAVYTESVHENPAFLSWEKCLECTLLHKDILSTIHQSLFTVGKQMSFVLHGAGVHQPRKSRITMKGDVPSLCSQTKIIYWEKKIKI